MAQEEPPEIKELRSEMHKGRLPLIEATRSAYKPYLITMKGWESKNAELPNIIQLYEPVGELHATYQQALANYETYIASWRGKLPDSDLPGRALELALTEIERSLR